MIDVGQGGPTPSNTLLSLTHPLSTGEGREDIILRTQEVERFVPLLNLDICRSFWNGEHDVSVVAT